MNSTEHLSMDYSLLRGKKSTYLLLSSIHILIGIVILIVVIVQQSGIGLAVVAGCYIAIGFVFFSRLFTQLHQYILINNDAITLKSLNNKSEQLFKWEDIISVILSPGKFIIIQKNRQIDVQLGILRFHDIREIKKKLTQIARQKGIRCSTIKPIANRST